jgi:5-methylcytosine-specific restriction endonuclease McrA
MIKTQTRSAAVREAVWRRFVGEDFETKCYTGCGSTINCFTFYCGHVIARSRGGLTTVENLRPICSTCKRRMGTEDMNEFIEDHRFLIPTPERYG